MTRFIAEFHDIGKIVDWKAIGLQVCDPEGKPIEKEPHDFEKCTGPEWAVNFSSPVWESVFRKDSQIVHTNYSHSLGWFLASLADELAAGLGRIRDETVTGSSQYCYYCLWTGEVKPDVRLKEPDKLKDLIAHLNENPSWGEAIQCYSQVLHSRAETARPGLNVTTLYSHSVLAGKLFRILYPLAAMPSQDFPSYSDGLKTFRSEKLTTVFIRVLFPQRPFRTRDLSVFQQRRDAMSETLSRYEDNVLVCYGENMLALFFSREEADTFIRDILDRGYLGLIRTGEKNLEEMRSIGIDRALGKEERVSGNLPDEIQPPLCEGCQMRHGEHRWPSDLLVEREDLSQQTKEYLRGTSWQALRSEELPECDRAKLTEWLEEWTEENLCSRCFDLRCQAEPLRKLAAWQTGTVAWARVALNLDSLVETLRRLHADYIRASARQIGPGLLDNLAVRFPVLADFVEDYRRFLGRWSAFVVEAFGHDMVEQVDDDLLCIRLNERREALRLLEIYREVMVDWFVKMFDLNVAPVRLGLSISAVKHPFFVHWRYLENPKVAVGIQVIGGGTAEIPLNRLGDILQAVGRGERGAFHRLRQIAQTSKSLADLVLSDRQDRDGQTFGELKRILPLGVDFESLVTLANLAEQ